MRKVTIRFDKLNRIYAIVWSDEKNFVTPEELKEALNMFRGRQKTSKNIKECLEYVKNVINKNSENSDTAAQAEKNLETIHVMWNR